MYVILLTAKTLLDLRESWEWTAKEDPRELICMMIDEVDVNLTVKHVVWVKARPDFDLLFRLLENLRIDDGRRFWIFCPETNKENRDTKEEMEQENNEIAQLSLSDLGRGACLHANHACRKPSVG